MTDRKDRKPAQQATPGTPRVGRRGFFGASLGVVAAGIAGGIAGGSALPAFAVETGDERTKARYKADSAHVKQFYHVNRLVRPESK